MSLPKQTKSKSFGFNDNKSNQLPIKLVIYDFDQTITCEHLYYELDGGQEDELKKMSDEKLIKVFGGNERMQRLTQHFRRVSLNCELAIISFGWVNVIKNALKRMQLLQYFTNCVIIGKDSEELKTAGSKAKCIRRMKKKRNLKSDQVVFVDDDNGNIQKAMSYSQTVLISPRSGMTPNHMKQIEQKCGVYPTHSSLQQQISLELTTPKTMSTQIQKHYPSLQSQAIAPNIATNNTNNTGTGTGSNNLDKYKIKSVPQWFDNLANPDPDSPVIQIGGDQTPNSESGEYELNVPLLTNELADIVTKKPKNGLSLILSSDHSDDQQESEVNKVVNHNKNTNENENK